MGVRSECADCIEGLKADVCGQGLGIVSPRNQLRRRFEEDPFVTLILDGQMLCRKSEPFSSTELSGLPAGFASR